MSQDKQMNVIQAIQDYITKMIGTVPGMKVFLMDKDTAGIVSIVFSQSQILQKEVYLFEKIDQKNREPMLHLKAICFLRPTNTNLEALREELKEPKYGEYHLFFSNSIKKTFVEELADSDENEVVQQLQEFFADYYSITPELFSLNISPVMSHLQTNWKEMLDRTVDGIASCLLSLKKQPQIRYAGKSEIAKKVVEELQRRISHEPGLFDFRKTEIPPLLLILDRRDDPVTPLLTQWTYQAMVHDLIGINNNRVNLIDRPGIKNKELQEVVISCEQDDWFRKNMFSNFGELGENVKALVDEYGQKAKINQNINSLDDIKRFVENYPEFRKQSGNVSKHVTLMSELSRVVGERHLLEVSQLEQSIANYNEHSNHVKEIKNFLEDPKFCAIDKVKVVMLYALRYQNNYSNEISSFLEKLRQLGIVEANLISTLLEYGGEAVRGSDLFEQKGFFKGIGKSLQRGMKGVENIYTEHKPYLKTILESLLINKLKDMEYPFASNSISSKSPPSDIIVFMIGGTTFEESLTVHEFNSRPNVRVILGGTCVQSSTIFLKDLQNIK